MSQDLRTDSGSGSPRFWAFCGLWLAVWVAFQLTFEWIRYPLGSTSSWSGLMFWPWVLIMASVNPRVVAYLNRKRADGGGVWFTPPSARVQRLCWAIPIAVLAGYLLFLAGALWSREEAARAAVAVGLAIILTVCFAAIVRGSARSVIELRIDADGVYTPKWGGTIAWADIEFASAPRGDDRSLRLMVKPNAAPGLPKATRDNGGFAVVRLGQSEAPWPDVLAALRAASPSIRIAPWTVNGFVLPIHGATDVPDIVR